MGGEGVGREKLGGQSLGGAENKRKSGRAGWGDPPLRLAEDLLAETVSWRGRGGEQSACWAVGAGALKQPKASSPAGASRHRFWAAVTRHQVLLLPASLHCQGGFASVSFCLFSFPFFL